MLIINADDWGRSVSETNAALSCHHYGRITSVSAMVFMQDSERAADLAKENGVDVGLHLNLSQSFDIKPASGKTAESHNRIVRFMTLSKYAVLLYHPGLRRAFHDAFRSQMDEFQRLYGKSPSHVDGHQHRHLCLNMLLDEVIPPGQRVRRNFSFGPGEKGPVNRTYRELVDRWLGRRYRLTDYFFSLGQSLKANRLPKITNLAGTSSVELMTHPINREEYAWLASDCYCEVTQAIQLAPYHSL